MKFQLCRKIVFAAAILFTLPLAIGSVEISLKDGTVLQGEIKSQTDKEIIIETDAMTVTVPRDRVKKAPETTEQKIEIEQMLINAEAYYNNGQYIKAEELYKKVLEKDPLNYIAHTKLKVIEDLKKLPGVQKQQTDSENKKNISANGIQDAAAIPSGDKTPDAQANNQPDSSMKSLAELAAQQTVNLNSQPANSQIQPNTQIQAPADTPQINSANAPQTGSPFQSAEPIAQDQQQNAVPVQQNVQQNASPAVSPFQPAQQNSSPFSQPQQTDSAAQNVPQQSIQQQNFPQQQNMQSLPPLNMDNQTQQSAPLQNSAANASSPFQPANPSAAVPVQSANTSSSASPFQPANTNSASPFQPANPNAQTQPQINNAQQTQQPNSSPFQTSSNTQSSPFQPAQNIASSAQNNMPVNNNSNAQSTQAIAPAAANPPANSPFQNMPPAQQQEQKTIASLPPLDSSQLNQNQSVVNNQNEAPKQITEPVKEVKEQPQFFYDAANKQQASVNTSSEPAASNNSTAAPDNSIAAAASAPSQNTTASNTQTVTQNSAAQVSSGDIFNREIYSVTPANYQQGSPEFRAVWITRYDWPAKTPEQIKQNIVNIMDTLEKNNFNAAIFQIRGQGDVLYKSPFEPWSMIVGGKDPGFDPLELAITEAHKRNIELHAYINLLPIWNGSVPPAHTTPEHPYWLYCSQDTPENWSVMDKNGVRMKPSKEYDGYVYMSAGIPVVHSYLRKVVLDVVQRYDVDGVHFDRIRYPGIQFSHDPVSKKRFAEEGNPDKLSWEDWQRDQITKMLNDIYGACYAVKPKVKFSASVWGIYDKTRIPGYSGFSSGYHEYYQDSQGWLKKGVMDAICPMIYWDSRRIDQKSDGKKGPCYLEIAKDFQDHTSNRHAYMGSAVYKKGADYQNEEFIKEINFTRAIDGKGNVLYAYTDTTKKKLWDDLKNGIYSAKVKTPDMPWRSAPQTGVIIGFVKDGSGNPVVDAKINISDRTENWISSGDGFFAILDVKPAQNIKLTVTKAGAQPAAIENIEVTAGKATQKDITLK